MSRLIDTLTNCWQMAEQCTLEDIQRAAQGLVDECARASALEHRQFLPAYFAALPNPDLETQAAIDGKRMTLDRTRQALRDGITSTAMLVGPPDVRPEPGQGQTDVLLQKLDAGGFSVVSCNAAKDLRDKADYLGISWTKKVGREKGLQRYEHIRTLVLSDSARAYEPRKG